MEQQVRSVSDMFKQISNVNFTECSMTNYHIKTNTNAILFTLVHSMIRRRYGRTPFKDVHVAIQCPIDRPLYQLDETM